MRVHLLDPSSEVHTSLRRSAANNQGRYIFFLFRNYQQIAVPQAPWFLLTVTSAGTLLYRPDGTEEALETAMRRQPRPTHHRVGLEEYVVDPLAVTEYLQLMYTPAYDMNNVVDLTKESATHGQNDGDHDDLGNPYKTNHDDRVDDDTQPDVGYDNNTANEPVLKRQRVLPRDNNDHANVSVATQTCNKKYWSMTPEELVKDTWLPVQGTKVLLGVCSQIDRLLGELTNLLQAEPFITTLKHEECRGSAILEEHKATHEKWRGALLNQRNKLHTLLTSWDDMWSSGSPNHVPPDGRDAALACGLHLRPTFPFTPLNHIRERKAIWEQLSQVDKRSHLAFRMQIIETLSPKGKDGGMCLQYGEYEPEYHDIHTRIASLDASGTRRKHGQNTVQPEDENYAVRLKTHARGVQQYINNQLEPYRGATKRLEEIELQVRTLKAHISGVNKHLREIELQVAHVQCDMLGLFDEERRLLAHVHKVHNQRPIVDNSIYNKLILDAEGERDAIQLRIQNVKAEVMHIRLLPRNDAEIDGGQNDDIDDNEDGASDVK